MCQDATTPSIPKKAAKMPASLSNKDAPSSAPLTPPSLMARYTCAAILVGIMGIWGKLTFVPETETPSVDVPLHSYRTPLSLTVGYLISLPILHLFTQRVLAKHFDLKALLFESMVLYNVAQVFLNGWMVYRFLDSLINRGHPFVGDISTVSTGTAYVVWVHYCDKYLEFFDTYFMVLRGKLDQVRNCLDVCSRVNAQSNFSLRFISFPIFYVFWRSGIEAYFSPSVFISPPFFYLIKLGPSHGIGCVDVFLKCPCQHLTRHYSQTQ